MDGTEYRDTYTCDGMHKGRDYSLYTYTMMYCSVTYR